MKSYPRLAEFQELNLWVFFRKWEEFIGARMEGILVLRFVIWVLDDKIIYVPDTNGVMAIGYLQIIYSNIIYIAGRRIV